MILNRYAEFGIPFLKYAEVFLCIVFMLSIQYQLVFS